MNGRGFRRRQPQPAHKAPTQRPQYHNRIGGYMAKSLCQGSKAALSQTCHSPDSVKPVERLSTDRFFHLLRRAAALIGSAKRRQGACNVTSVNVFSPHTTGAPRCRLLGVARPGPTLQVICGSHCSDHSPRRAHRAPQESTTVHPSVILSTVDRSAAERGSEGARRAVNRSSFSAYSPFAQMLW